MSEAVQLAYIVMASSAINAAIGVAGLWISKGNKATIQTLEKNTNSIKDALVASTEKEAHARGVKEGEESKGRNP